MDARKKKYSLAGSLMLSADYTILVLVLPSQTPKYGAKTRGLSQTLIKHERCGDVIRLEAAKDTCAFFKRA